MIDWNTVVSRNQVYLDIERAEIALRQLEDGTVNAVYISGPAGVGKTRIVVKAVERFRRSGREALSIGGADSLEDVRAVLAQSCGRRPVVMNDENSMLFSSMARLNLFKAATETGTNLHGGVYVKAPIIVCTNADLSAKGFSASKQARIPALWGATGPGVSIDIERDRQELWEYTCHLALQDNLIRVVRGRRERLAEVPIHVALKSLDWFTTNSHRLAHLTPRTLQNVARNFVHGSGKLLDRNLQSFLTDNVMGARMPAQDWRAAWEQANCKTLVTNEAYFQQPDRINAAISQRNVAQIISRTADRAAAHG